MTTQLNYNYWFLIILIKIYGFCVKNKLDFNTNQEINTQIQNVLKDKQLEEIKQIDKSFQKIKEEEDKKNKGESTKRNQRARNIKIIQKILIRIRLIKQKMKI